MYDSLDFPVIGVEWLGKFEWTWSSVGGPGVVLVDHEWYGRLLVVQAGFRMMGHSNRDSYEVARIPRSEWTWSSVCDSGVVLAGVWGWVSGFEWSMVVPQPTISPVSPKNCGTNFSEDSLSNTT